MKARKTTSLQKFEDYAQKEKQNIIADFYFKLLTGYHKRFEKIINASYFWRKCFHKVE